MRLGVGGRPCLKAGKGVSSHPLLLLLPGDVAPLDLPVAQEVAEVAEDGQDAVAHVGEHGHQHGRLLEGLDEGPAVQAAAMVRRCVDLGIVVKTDKGHESLHYGLSGCNSFLKSHTVCIY